ncbi:hypothetical protein BB559_002148 [Furculomyces boomerangus]|uniref:Uncharacterized protein n=2 Tax=Harpellales TaxID=61421 RepID=A0A2T9YXS1_9FUNG|nr:hypothetical protein BB559_002148 [Furculomyces boomerangus]
MNTQQNMARAGMNYGMYMGVPNYMQLNQMMGRIPYPVPNPDRSNIIPQQQYQNPGIQQIQNVNSNQAKNNSPNRSVQKRKLDE